MGVVPSFVIERGAEQLIPPGQNPGRSCSYGARGARHPQHMVIAVKSVGDKRALAQPSQPRIPALRYGVGRILHQLAGQASNAELRAPRRPLTTPVASTKLCSMPSDSCCGHLLQQLIWRLAVVHTVHGPPPGMTCWARCIQYYVKS